MLPNTRPAIAEHAEAEDVEEKQDSDTDKRSDRINRRDKEESVVNAVEENRHGIEIAHSDRKQEMRRHGEHSPSDSDRLPIGSRKEIDDIFGSGKAHADTDRIDNTVEALIEPRVVPEQEPEHEQLERLFGYSSKSKSLEESLPPRSRLGGEEPCELQHSFGNHREEGRDAAESKSAENLRKRFTLVFVLPPDVKDEQKGGQDRSKKDYKSVVHKQKKRMRVQR